MGEKHTPPPYRDFAHNFAPFFGRCCPQKRFISLNFGAILNLAFLSVPAVPFGGIAGQINRQRRGYHEKTHREHDTGTQYDALHSPCIRICRCRNVCCGSRDDSCRYERGNNKFRRYDQDRRGRRSARRAVRHRLELRQLQQMAGHCRRCKCKDRVYSGWRCQLQCGHLDFQQ